MSTNQTTNSRARWISRLGALLATFVIAAGLAGALTAAPAGAATAPLTRTTVSVGSGHVCGVASDGTVDCWGENAGKLGFGPTSNSTVFSRPVPVSTAGTVLEGKTIAQISAGAFHTCAVTTDGIAACWGRNYFGGLGDGTTVSSDLPVAVTTTGTPLEGKRVAEISAGSNYTCAVTIAGVAACWGGNSFGVLGTGNSYQSSVPQAVKTADTALAGKSVAHISAGDRHTCAATTDGVAVCWGSRVWGRLGEGGNSYSPAYSAVAVTTAGTALAGKTVTGIGVNDHHTCAVTSDGGAGCWGGNDYGELGNNSTTSSFVPVAVATAGSPLAGKAIIDVSVGGYHTCAVTSDHTAACWGNGINGRLGTGTTTSSTRPVAMHTAGTPLAGLAIARISAGAHSTCVVATNGTAACSGHNGWGQLGDGTTTNSTVPVAVLPRAVASAPTIGVASPGNGKATVRWTAPATSGSAAITGYIVASYQNGVRSGLTTQSSTATTGTASYLTNGVTYTFRVAAVTAAGQGQWSAPSNPVTPSAVPVAVPPNAPTAAKVVSGKATSSTGTLTVTYKAGADNGTAIAQFTATCTSTNGGVTRSGARNSATAGAITVAGVTTKKSYACTVTATNAGGVSPASAATGKVVAGTPAAPTGVRAAKAAAGRLKVTFTPGSSNGAPTTKYTATCTSSNGGVTRAKSGTVRAITVTSLTHGKRYTCTVKATNSRGTGLRSVASGMVKA